MKITLRGRAATLGGNGERELQIGAAVVRPHPAGAVLLEFGPADGPPTMTIELSQEEANHLAAAVQTVADDGDEDVVLIDS